MKMFGFINPVFEKVPPTFSLRDFYFKKEFALPK